jgi:4'-phosphopantetheinyl transferase
MKFDHRPTEGMMHTLPFVQIISIEHPPETSRTAARAAIRMALRELMAEQYGLHTDQVLVVSVPGAAPRLLLDGRPILGGLSFSHDGQHSYAAFNETGQVGVDLMRVQEVADWEILARDYLGPAVLQRLQSIDEQLRGRSFAQEWTKREAMLKSTGLALSEWTELPGTFAVLPVEAPEGYVAAAAIHDARQPPAAGRQR